MADTAGTVHVDVVPRLDTTEIEAQLATLEPIAVWHTSIVPNWITAISALGILITTLIR